MSKFFFFFNDTATTEIYTLSLHDALPIFTGLVFPLPLLLFLRSRHSSNINQHGMILLIPNKNTVSLPDRKSTRLNSSHANISYAVFCLKKKNHLLRMCNFSVVSLSLFL